MKANLVKLYMKIKRGHWVLNKFKLINNRLFTHLPKKNHIFNIFLYKDKLSKKHEVRKISYR